MKVHLENWNVSTGNRFSSIVGAVTQDANCSDIVDLFAYDGVLVCESVTSREHAELISIAPSMLRLLLMIERRSDEGAFVDSYYENQIVERAKELLNGFRARIAPEMRLLPLPIIKLNHEIDSVGKQ